MKDFWGETAVSWVWGLSNLAGWIGIVVGAIAHGWVGALIGGFVAASVALVVGTLLLLFVAALLDRPTEARDDLKAQG